MWATYATPPDCISTTESTSFSMTVVQQCLGARTVPLGRPLSRLATEARRYGRKKVAEISRSPETSRMRSSWCRGPRCSMNDRLSARGASWNRYVAAYRPSTRITHSRAASAGSGHVRRFCLSLRNSPRCRASCRLETVPLPWILLVLPEPAAAARCTDGADRHTAAQAVTGRRRQGFVHLRQGYGGQEPR
jgi:hypothetical protein